MGLTRFSGYPTDLEKTGDWGGQRRVRGSGVGLCRNSNWTVSFFWVKTGDTGPLNGKPDTIWFNIPYIFSEIITLMRFFFRCLCICQSVKFPFSSELCRKCAFFLNVLNICLVENKNYLYQSDFMYHIHNYFYS